ncbi:MAG: AI-2E family transporter [Candidatus Adiutrix sp.]|jgi:predicted PurR-regulated permease PerM|nr:AI-2E family transporter [Candidatus Adiutrix sp.]
MDLSIARFIRLNKVIVIWTAFAGLLYLFRDMFGLIFITFVMCFLTHGLTSHRFRLGGLLHRRFLVVMVYFLALVLVGAVIVFVIPRLVAEARSFTEQLPATLSTIERWLNAQVPEDSSLEPVVERIRSMLTPERVIIRGWAMGWGAVEKGFHYVTWFFLGLLFSFLIMLDLPRLTRSVRELRFTRAALVYEETVDSVILFAKVVGENFRAQIIISAINTALTAIGLRLLGIEGAILLCTLVFFCGLIPVLGVLISSIPIGLMAVNAGGVTLGLWAGVMIVLIHLVEAYVLNPRIVSRVMHLNPVMILLILYIAHSLIGMWGMLLGVPISIYIYRQLILGGPGPANGAAPPKTEPVETEPVKAEAAETEAAETEPVETEPVEVKP